jgi:hypothetical protein
MKKLKGVKGIKRFKTLKTTKRGKLPEFTGMRGPSYEVVSDPVVRDFHQRLGGKGTDLSLARRAATLQRRMPQATLPELVAYDWLKANNHQFEYQVQVAGGRSIQGGLVPDFIVNRGATGMVWLVQGEYWHSSLGQSERDKLAVNSFRGLVVNGLKIEDVVQLWEDDVYNKRPQVFEWAMEGIGLRG